MTNAQLFVAIHGAIDALKTRRALIVGEVNERRKRLLKLAGAISQKSAVHGPTVLAEDSGVTPEELALVLYPTADL